MERLFIVIHVSKLYTVLLYSTLYFFYFIWSLHVNSCKSKMYRIEGLKKNGTHISAELICITDILA